MNELTRGEGETAMDTTNPTQNDVAEAAPVPQKPRGFAAMDRALVRELGRRGARASHARGTAHRFTSDEARAAGRKGGSAPHRVRGRGKSERPEA
jgi:general stress protein YciG